MDQTTELLSSYACGLTFEDLSPETVHQVKRTLVDTLGCAIGGYLSEPAKIARRLAGSVTSSAPSRIIGTHTHRDRATSVRSHQDHSRRIADRHQVRDRVAQIVDPALKREVAFALATTSEVERHRDAPELVGGAIHQLREGAG